eukprot:gene28738-31916_t
MQQLRSTGTIKRLYSAICRSTGKHLRSTGSNLRSYQCSNPYALPGSIALYNKGSIYALQRNLNALQQHLRAKQQSALYRQQSALYQQQSPSNSQHLRSKQAAICALQAAITLYTGSNLTLLTGASDARQAAIYLYMQQCTLYSSNVRSIQAAMHNLRSTGIIGALQAQSPPTGSNLRSNMPAILRSTSTIYAPTGSNPNLYRQHYALQASIYLRSIYKQHVLSRHNAHVLLHSQQSNALQAAIYALQAAIYALQAAIYALQAAIYALQAAICALQAAIYALQAAIYALQAAIYALQAAIYALQAAMYALQAAICALQAAIYALQAAIYALQAAIYALQAAMYALQAAICALQAAFYARYLCESAMCSAHQMNVPWSAY